MSDRLDAAVTRRRALWVGGRDHWPGCYSLVLAGGGIAPGGVYGAPDSIPATPTRDPVSPNDLLATVYHLLGVDHREVLYDLERRPHVVVEGEPVMGLWGCWREGASPVIGSRGPSAAASTPPRSHPCGCPSPPHRPASRDR